MEMNSLLIVLEKYFDLNLALTSGKSKIIGTKCPQTHDWENFWSLLGLRSTRLLRSKEKNLNNGNDIE